MWIIIALIVGLILCGMIAGVKENKAGNIERRRLYAESLGENIRVLVNDGTHFFYVDDLHKTYGIDESGRRYSLNDIVTISAINNRITIQQKGNPLFIDIGDMYTVVSKKSIDVIVDEIMKLVRVNLDRELYKNGITATKEYVHNGSIWGYDIESRKFYTTQYGISIFDFTDLLSVKIENKMGDKHNIEKSIIHVNVKKENGDSSIFEYDLYFYEVNNTYHDLLSMFKGIRNRTGAPKKIKSDYNSSNNCQSSVKDIDPTSCVYTVHQIVKSIDRSKETDLEGVVELFICALIKYTLDKTPILRSEKLNIFDRCINTINFISVIKGEDIYGDNFSGEVRELIGSLDHIATGFPKLICNYADTNTSVIFLNSVTDLVRWIETYITNCEKVEVKNVSTQYINEIQDMLKCE